MTRGKMRRLSQKEEDKELSALQRARDAAVKRVFFTVTGASWIFTA